MFNMKKVAVAALLLVQETYGQQWSTETTCSKCMEQKGRYCLDSNKLDYGKCCDPSSTSDFQCQAMKNEFFCVDANKVTDADIQEVACKSNKDKCPILQDDYQIIIKEKDTWVLKGWQWDETVPLAEAKDWNCKYQVEAHFTPDDLTNDKYGLIELMLEQYGFDETVEILVHPIGEITDSPKSKIFPVQFGDTWYVPANLGIVVMFAPTGMYEGDKTSEVGFFRLRAKLVDEVDDKKTTKSNVFTISLGDNDEIKDNIAEQDPKRVEKDYVPPQPDNKVTNWDGLVVDVKGLLSEKLFEIQGYDVTGQDVALATIIAIVVGSICCCACICVAFSKRKQIIVHTRRLSRSIRGSSMDGDSKPQTDEQRQQEMNKMFYAAGKEGGEKVEDL